MKRSVWTRAAIVLPLALLTAVPASAANWFSPDPATGLRRHIGSAPNPTPEDLRALRAAADEAAKAAAAKSSDLNKPSLSTGG